MIRKIPRPRARNGAVVEPIKLNPTPSHNVVQTTPAPGSLMTLVRADSSLDLTN